MPIGKYHNQQYGTLGGSNLPLRTGDRRWSQDRVLDFRYQQDLVGLGISDLIVIPAVFSGGVVTQGGGANLNITAGYGYAKFEVDIPDSFASIPPTVTQEDLEAIRIAWGAQTNINASDPNCSVYTVVDDGATPNYVKMRYLETDGNTRNRAKYTGSYAYEIIPEFDLIVDGNAPTDYDIHLATFTSSGGTYTFTFNATILVEPNINLSKLAVGTTAVKGADGVVHIAAGINADTNWLGNAPLIIENDDDAYINIRTPNNKIGGIAFSDPDATYRGKIDYEHGNDRFDIYVAASQMLRLTSTGLYIGGAVDPSNLLHVQGTTTPQQRWAYDNSNYSTLAVYSNGQLYIQSNGTNAGIQITPASSYPFVDLYLNGSTVRERILSSTGTKYIYFEHNGSNGIIATGGTSAGNILISNTTESTSKDTGSLIVEGGVGVEKNVVNGGYLKSGKGRWPTNHLQGSSVTYNTIFDTLSPYIPNTNDEILLTGGGGWGAPSVSIAIYNRAVKTSATTIDIYFIAINHTAGTVSQGSFTVTDGSGAVIDYIAISW